MLTPGVNGDFMLLVRIIVLISVYLPLPFKMTRPFRVRCFQDKPNIRCVSLASFHT